MKPILITMVTLVEDPEKLAEEIMALAQEHGRLVAFIAGDVIGSEEGITVQAAAQSLSFHTHELMDRLIATADKNTH